MPEVEKKLQNYLILNKYLSSLFGLKNFEDFRKILKDAPEGISENKKLYFTEILQKKIEDLKISNEIIQDLNQYDENIQKYLNHINERRNPPIRLKYFQYITILFTEIYLDKYFNNFDSFYSNYCNYAMECNIKENKKGTYTYPSPNNDFLKKLCIWSATGSGKTIIMHINFLQIKRYNNRKYDNYLLITLNEGLSKQHIEELNKSNIPNQKFEIQKTLDDYLSDSVIKVIEITKIDGGTNNKNVKKITVENFGDNNIIFIDEGHKGHSTESKVWKTNQKKISGKNGFIFEYSATFAEITGNDYTFKEYASTIINDYRYKFFHEDGFGKDYSISDLKDYDKYGDEYFTGALLSFYEQKIYFRDNKKLILPFNIKNPLMIFVGSRVSSKEDDPDVLLIIKFIAKFVNKISIYQEYIKNILTDKSSLVNEYNQPLFSSKFPYLRKLIRENKINIDDIHQDILKNIFTINAPKTLQLIESKNAEGEIGLKFEKEFFGLINIGDTNSFINRVEQEAPEYIKVIDSKSDFKSLFDSIDKDTSTINFLIGSKKFLEGWNSFRVSTMGLLNIGKKQGTQIIQLFGRGIRLKGYSDYLKRSYILRDENLIPSDIIIPENIDILETLNIFGLNADYMITFKETLREEGIEEFLKIPLKIKPKIPITTLYVPRSSVGFSDFIYEVNITKFNHNIEKIVLDLSSKINILESKSDLRSLDSDSPIKVNPINDDVLSLINFQNVFIELLKYKDIKKYSNLYFSKRDLEEIAKSKNYDIICKKEIIEINTNEELDKIKKIEEYIIQILKIHMDKIYNYEKNKFYQKYLDYETISEEDDSLIPNKYMFSIDVNSKSAIQNPNEFYNNLENFIRLNSKESENIYTKDLNFNSGLLEESIIKFLAFDIHLFEPLIYKNKDRPNLKFIKISPIQLVKSEKDFVVKLRSYLEDRNKELDIEEIYLLRNPSRTGIGFFGTSYFYPDFILWTLKGNEQNITFIDPKGLIRIDQKNEKLNLYKEIKQIESCLKNKQKTQIKLNSFIISPTLYKDLKWGITKDDFIARNILFLEDYPEFLDQLFQKIKEQ